MSSATRDHGIVRRMVSFPRSIMGEFSRSIDDGMNFMGIGNRRNQNVFSSFHVQPLLPPLPGEPRVLPEEWAFLESFEQQYSTTHPFFYVCRFMEALKLAEQDKKFMFMYLHSPEHPFTHIFCSQTLCSELVTQFLDVNFVCWGALADRGEGLQMVSILRPTTFPCCAVIVPAPGDTTITVLKQIEGPVSPAELVAILQRTMEEHGAAFGSAQPKYEENIRAKRQQEEKIQADRQLREEQDAAYLAALQMDKEKERLNKLKSRDRVLVPAETSNTRKFEKPRNNSVIKQPNKGNEFTTTKENQFKGIATRGRESQPTQILIRFPNGERREHSFLCTDKIQSIFTYIDSLGLQGIGTYRLVSSFPRRVYGVDQMRMTLKDAGLHPKASLFLEPV